MIKSMIAYTESAKRRKEIYSCNSSLNRESLMNVQVDTCKEWVTPEVLVKADKTVAISKTGLNVNWKD